MKRHDFWIFPALMALGGAIFLLYWRTLAYPFEFDDYSNVIFNRAIRYLFHPKILFETFHQRMRPMTNLSFAFDYYRDGLSVSQFRITNISIHALNSGLIGLLLFRLFNKNIRLAILGASLFAFHPLAAESAIYISGRSVLLALFFMLFSIHIFISEAESFLGKIFLYFLFVFCTVLGVLSKESAAVLPLLIFPFLRFQKRKVIVFIFYIAPFFVLAAFFLLKKWTYIDAAWAGFFRFQGQIAIHSIWDFFRLQISLWPKICELLFNVQAISIDHSISAVNSWFAQKVLLGIFGLFLIIVMIIFSYKKYFNLFWGFWIFIFLLAPTNSIFPTADPIGERHVYASVLGFVFILCSIADYFLNRKYQIGTFLFLIFIPMFVFFTILRQEAWSSSSNLWLDALKKYPESLRIAFNAANAVAVDRNDYKFATEILSKQLLLWEPGKGPQMEQKQLLSRLSAYLFIYGAGDHDKVNLEIAKILPPATVPVWNTIVTCEYYLRSQQYDAAEIAAANLYEGTADIVLKKYASVYRARAALQLKKYVKAIEFYEVVFQKKYIDTIYWPEFENLGNAYLEAGQEKQGVLVLEKYIAKLKMFNQYPFVVMLKLAEIYKKNEDYARAADVLGEIIRVNTDNPKVRAEYVSMLEKLNRPTALIDKQKEEANYYSKNHISEFDTKDMVKP